MLLFHFIDRSQVCFFDQIDEEGEQEMEENNHSSQPEVDEVPEISVIYSFKKKHPCDNTGDKLDV